MVTRESKNNVPIVEYTSVTKTVRRVARFDPNIVRQAITVNQPTRIVLNHLDYIDTSCKHINKLTDKTSEFVNEIEFLIGEKIGYMGFDPVSLVERTIKTKKIKNNMSNSFEEV